MAIQDPNMINADPFSQLQGGEGAMDPMMMGMQPQMAPPGGQMQMPSEQMPNEQQMPQGGQQPQEAMQPQMEEQKQQMPPFNDEVEPEMQGPIVAGQQTFQDVELDVHPELVNLAFHLEEEELSRIGDLVCTDYEEDEDSRQEWLEKQAEWVRLYFQKDKPKSPPWPGSSSESVPILVEGCNQFHSRAYKAFFASPNFVKAVPIGHIEEVDRDRAERVGFFMSWQLEVKDRSYKRNKDRLLRALPLHGSFFTKTYRDPIKKENVVENVRAIDLVVPYSSVGMDIEEVERKTHILWLPLRKGAYLAAQKFFTHKPESYEELETNIVQREVDSATGMSQPFTSTTKPAKILEQHRFLDLDGDGLEEPYIVWVDYQSRKVLRIAIRYATDEWGQPTNNKEPLEFFTHYVYLENPDGFYGLGLGHLTGDINKAVNRMLRQSIDAATLQNIRPGFATKNAGIRKGYLEFEIGKITTVDGMMDDIRKSIMFIDFPGPSQHLIQLMDNLAARADRLNMVTDMLTGQPDKVYQPTTAMAQIEQGLMTFTAVQTRVYAALEQELQKLYRLNRLYAKEREYFAIQDAMGQQQKYVTKTDFAEDLQIRPILDPLHATDEAKMKRAAAEWEMVVNNPIITNSPQHFINATKRYLESINSRDLEQILPDPQQFAQQQAQQQQAQQQAAQQQAQMQQVEAQTKQLEVQTDQFRAQTERMDVVVDAQNKKTSNAIKQRANEQKNQINSVKTAAELEQIMTNARIRPGQ